jgi:hypothetical protein
MPPPSAVSGIPSAKTVRVTVAANAGKAALVILDVQIMDQQQVNARQAEALQAVLERGITPS